MPTSTVLSWFGYSSLGAHCPTRPGAQHPCENSTPDSRHAAEVAWHAFAKEMHLPFPHDMHSQDHSDTLRS